MANPTSRPERAAARQRPAQPRPELGQLGEPRPPDNGPPRDRGRLPVVAGGRRPGRRAGCWAACAWCRARCAGGVATGALVGGPEEAWAELRDTARRPRCRRGRAPVAAGDPGPARAAPRRARSTRHRRAAGARRRRGARGRGRAGPAGAVLERLALRPRGRGAPGSLRADLHSCRGGARGRRVAGTPAAGRSGGRARCSAGGGRAAAGPLETPSGARDGTAAWSTTSGEPGGCVPVGWRRAQSRRSPRGGGASAPPCGP